jgi:hypothetical protein
MGRPNSHGAWLAMLCYRFAAADCKIAQMTMTIEREVMHQPEFAT